MQSKKNFFFNRLLMKPNLKNNPMNTYLFMGDNMTQEVLEAVKEAKEQSKPRNFTQSVDMIVNIRDLDVKNQKIGLMRKLLFLRPWQRS